MDTSFNNNNVESFSPTHAIVLSELTTREKEKYYQLLLSNNAKFSKDNKGRFIANIRMLAPNQKKSDHDPVNHKKKRDVSTTNSSQVPAEDRLKRLEQEGSVQVKIIGVESFDYNSYVRFAVLIANNGDIVKPRVRMLSWAMKIIEELYDARFTYEKMDVERDEDIAVADKLVSVFPIFVLKRLSNMVGLKTIMDQTCWDLLYNIHMYRRDYLEVEIFARFLQEFYDLDDLLFFLYIRSVISKVLHISFRTRWAKSDGPGRQPKALWMSYRECVQVARIVFGANNETMCKDFLGIVNPQMVGQKTETSDSRRIDITQFLHLAVVGYHQTHPQTSQQGSGDSNPNPNNNHQLSQIPGTKVIEPPIPDPAPSSGMYMSRFVPTFEETKLQFDEQQIQQQNQQYAEEKEQVQVVPNKKETFENCNNEQCTSNNDESSNFVDEYYLGTDLVSIASKPFNTSNPNPSLLSNENNVPSDLSNNDLIHNEESNYHSNNNEEVVYNENGELNIITESDDESEEKMNEYSYLQLEREREFLVYLCESLQELDEEMVNDLVGALSDQLRLKVNEYLESYEVTDLESFDQHILEYLRSDDLRYELETIRNNMVQFILSDEYNQEGDNNGDGDEE
jgi:hypothetical protein